MSRLKLSLIIFIIAVALCLLFLWKSGVFKQFTLTPEQAVVNKFECFRCHEMPAPFESNTVDHRVNCRVCHQQILKGELDGDYPHESTKKWKKSIRHLTEVPSLNGLHKRMQRQWFVGFLQNPNIVRPHLLSMMPRLPISGQEANLIADYFGFAEKEALATLPKGGVKKGATLFKEKGCNSCHQFSRSNEPLTSSYPNFHTPAIPNKIKRHAPDLRYTQQRMSPEQIIQWLKDPQKLKAGTLMPKVDLTESEITNLLAYILSPIVERKPTLSTFKKPHSLNRAVPYKEVEEKVFKKLCWHCHSDPDGNRGDGGPGNTGGFGYRGSGLDLGSYEAIMRGSKQKNGQYSSIIQKDAMGESRLVQHIIARHNEMRGYVDKDILGMPLSLPPLTKEQIQLVVTWIEQGAKP